MAKQIQKTCKSQQIWEPTETKKILQISTDLKSGQRILYHRKPITHTDGARSNTAMLAPHHHSFSSPPSQSIAATTTPNQIHRNHHTKKNSHRSKK
jgi:hypothetical protein